MLRGAEHWLARVYLPVEGKVFSSSMVSGGERTW